MKISMIALGAALLAASPALAADLVSNGGFETGNLTSWTLSGNTGFSSVQSFAAFTGSFGYRNGAVGSFGVLSQTVATVSGATYAYSFALRNNGGPDNAFEASLGGTAFGPSFTNSGPFGYTVFSGTVVAPTSNALLSFSFRQDPNFWNFDNASLISAVPEPATWGLMILGFGMVGASVRRRRSVVTA